MEIQKTKEPEKDEKPVLLPGYDFAYESGGGCGLVVFIVIYWIIIAILNGLGWIRP